MPDDTEAPAFGGGWLAGTWRVSEVASYYFSIHQGTMNETRIVRLRQERGWTQERLAAESGVGIRTIQRLEAGSDASLETLSLVAGALDVSLRDLFTKLDNDDLSHRVESLETRTHHQQAKRDGITRAWRWLYIGIGIILSLLSLLLSDRFHATSSSTSVAVFDGPGLVVLLLSYWLGGYIVFRAVRKLYLDPHLDEKYPLSKPKTSLRTKQPTPTP